MLAVVTLVNREVSKARKHAENVANTIGAFTVGEPIGGFSSPSTEITFALVDGKTGEILWADRKRGAYNLTSKNVRSRATGIVAELP